MTTQTKGVDAWGRVNGEVPPVALGPHMFRIKYSNLYRLDYSHDVGDRVNLGWTATQSNDPAGPHQFGYSDFFAPNVPERYYEPGGEYFFLLFECCQTRETYTGRVMRAFHETALPCVVSNDVALWDQFPWHLALGDSQDFRAEERWAKKFHRPPPPRDFFVHEHWMEWTVQALVYFLIESEYWTRLHYSELLQGKMPEADAAKWAPKLRTEAINNAYELLELKHAALRKWHRGGIRRYLKRLRPQLR